jgi:hypothetical protein
MAVTLNELRHTRHYYRLRYQTMLSVMPWSVLDHKYYREQISKIGYDIDKIKQYDYEDYYYKYMYAEDEDYHRQLKG